ncbi:MAG: hypothetical protein LWW85_14895 [Marinilabiliales bacterium]|nr:hypothetical protein [Marinilabiliales bacterium]
MKIQLGQDYPNFFQALLEDPPQSIRINPNKTNPPSLLPSVRSCHTGYYLPERPMYTLDPCFHAGAYYVQEASSMFLEQLVSPHVRKGLKVLDLCAAPGGKSTHLSSLLSEDCLLVSNEVIRSRATILSENLRKWGNVNTVVTCNDPRDFTRMSGFFDIILVDAPCSGEGLFRRDPEAIQEWSEANTALCTQRQRRILADIWPALAEGGILIYSTCTYNPEENEGNIAWLKENMDAVPAVPLLTVEKGIEVTDALGIPCYRFYPHKVKGEGFFATAVAKQSSTDRLASFKGKSFFQPAGKQQRALVKDLLIDPGYFIFQFEEELIAWPQMLQNDLESIKANLRIIQAGVKIGSLVHQQILPAHELAVSSVINRAYFPEEKISLPDALRYLKKEDFQPVSNQKGWHLVTYKGIPLGWMKHLGNRINGQYPKEWRIRMSIDAYIGERLRQENGKFPFPAGADFY